MTDCGFLFKPRATNVTYICNPVDFAFRQFRLISFIFFAGIPAQIQPLSRVNFCVTTAPAAMMVIISPQVVQPDGASQPVHYHGWCTHVLLFPALWNIVSDIEGISHR